MRRFAAAFAIVAVVLWSPSVVSAQTPSPAQSAQTSANPELEKGAKAFYDSLVSGTPDRAHMSSDLNSAMTDDLVKTISGQLKALGTPTWTTIKSKTTADGDVAEYKLSYSGGISVYYSFGETKKGTIFLAFLGNNPPPQIV